MMPAPLCQTCSSTLTADGECPACMLRTALGSSTEPASESGIPSVLPRRFGSFELLEEIARGGMGIVYRARQEGLNRVVALKVLIGGAYSSESLVRRFHLEAESAAGLQHPGIVTIHEFGEYDHQPYYTMDYVKGRNLSEIVAGQPLPATRAARYLHEIASAVRFAHEQGIVHRDLKPSNVLIDENDRPRITDFGLAKRLQHSADVTIPGQMLGSPNYAPPEQSSGGEASVGVTSDIYSLGALLYCLMTSRPPFLAGTIEETRRLVAEEEPIAPRALNPAIPRDLETICLKCLEKDPSRRYASAEQLVEELNRFRLGQPIHARPVSPAEQLWRWGRRHPAVAGLAATFVVALIVTTTVFYTSAVRVERARALEAEAHIKAENNLYAASMQIAAIGFAAANGIDPHAHRRSLEGTRPKPGGRDLRGFEWRHFWLRGQSDAVASLVGHTRLVDTTLFSPDAAAYATRSIDGVLKLWDARTHRELQTIGDVSRVGGFETNTTLIFSREDRTLWRVNLSSKSISRILSSTGQLLGLAGDRSAIIVGRDGRPALQPLSEIGPVEAGANLPPNSCAAIAPNARRAVVTGPTYPGIVVTDLATGREVKVIADRRPVIALCLSPDGGTVVSAGFDGVLKIFDVSSGEQRTSFKGFLDPIWGLAFSHDGSRFAAGGNNRDLKVWRTSDWSLLATRFGHTSTVHTVAFSPDDSKLISGGEDELALVWVAEGTRLPTEAPQLLRGPGWGDSLPSFEFSSDSNFIVGTAADGTVKLWRTDSFAVEKTFPAEVRTVAFSTDGESVLGERFDGTVQRWSLGNPESAETIPATGKFANWPLEPFTTRERVALVADQADLRARCRLCSISSTRDAINAGAMSSASAIAMSHDGSLMFIGSSMGGVEVWDVRTQTQRLSFEGHKLGITSVAVSNDGRYLATGSMDNSTKLWDATTGRLLTTFYSHNRPVWALAFSPDGQTLATGSCDKAVVLCSIPLLQTVANLSLYVGLPQGFEQEVRLLRFSPDGNILAAALGDGTLRFFRAAPFSQTDSPAQQPPPAQVSL